MLDCCDDLLLRRQFGLLLLTFALGKYGCSSFGGNDLATVLLFILSILTRLSIPLILFCGLLLRSGTLNNGCTPFQINLGLFNDLNWAIYIWVAAGFINIITSSTAVTTALINMLNHFAGLCLISKCFGSFFGWTLQLLRCFLSNESVWRRGTGIID